MNTAWGRVGKETEMQMTVGENFKVWCDGQGRWRYKLFGNAPRHEDGIASSQALALAAVRCHLGERGPR